MGGKPQRNEPTVRQAGNPMLLLLPLHYPPASRIYNNHRQLTWRTADLYLLAMATVL